MTHPLFKIGITALLAAGLSVPATAQTPQIQKLPTPPAVTPLPMKVGGRVQTTHPSPCARICPDEYQYQWPGTYFETAFKGRELFFNVGTNHEILHIVVDGKPPLILNKPEPGIYHLSGLSNKPHTASVLVATESQDAHPTPSAASRSPPMKSRCLSNPMLARSNSSATPTPSATEIPRPSKPAPPTRSGPQPTTPKPSAR